MPDAQDGDRNHEGSLLLADLAHFGESFWRNEDVGEKRLNVFLTLATAVAAGLAALKSSDSPPVELPEIAAAAGVALLAVGVTTYFRMVHRNRVAKQYQDTLLFIRRRYLAGTGRCYDLPVPIASHARWIRGGYAETFSVLNGLLVVGIMLVLTVRLEWAIAAGLAAAAAGWAGAAYARQRGSSAKVPAQYFRCGTGAVIARSDGRVLVLERTGIAGAWQFPQGGLEAGETPDEGVLREVREETGLTPGQLTRIARVSRPLAYELPLSMRSAKTGNGQVQYWYLFRLAEDAEVRLPRSGEFRDARWVSLPEAATSAVAFRQPLYQALVDEFSPLL